MTKENKFKIGLCLQGIALSMDEITLKANEDRLKMIEEIIIAEPTGYEQELCSDTISRQAVINSFKNWLNDNKDPRSFEDVIKDMPSATSTETWNGMHGQVTAPKGTFEKIFNDAKEDDYDI